MIEERELTPEAQADRDEFENKYGYRGNCSCHISPPCGSCTHPGNPLNQEDDDCYVMAEAIEPREITAMTKQYCYSLSGEEYHGRYGDLKEALADGIETACNYGAKPHEAHVWVAECVPYQGASPDCLADDIIERMQENAYNEGSEYADDYLDGVPEEEKQILAAFLGEWEARNGQPARFYTVENAALYIGGKWMPAGEKFEDFGRKLRRDIGDSASRHKAVLEQMAKCFIATHQSPVATPLSPEGIAA